MVKAFLINKWFGLNGPLLFSLLINNISEALYFNYNCKWVQKSKKAKILDGGGHFKLNDYVFGFQMNLEFGHSCFRDPLNYQKFTCV